MVEDAVACCSRCTALESGRSYNLEANVRPVRVELLHKLRDERKYDSLAALQQGIAQGLCRCARLVSQYEQIRHAETRRQTTRDRI